MVEYKVCLTTKVNPAKLEAKKVNPRPIIVIEPEDYKVEEVQAIRKKGYRVLAYLSLGTNEKGRKWYNTYKEYNLSQLENWPDEYYVDVRKASWREHLVNQAKKYKAMGFDGYWLDNLDVYEYHKSKTMYSACLIAIQKVKAVGGYVMINGGSEFFDYFMDHDSKHLGIDAVNGVTQEEVYSLIKDYSKRDKDGKKGIFGEQTKDMHKWYKSYMKRLKRHKFETFLLEYTRSSSLKKRIKNYCTTNKMTGYYISGDVDL